MMQNTENIKSILARFPKVRPSMTPEISAIHKALLKANRERGTPLTMISHALESWMHRFVARRDDLKHGHAVIEIGAGTLNHLPFERSDVAYDVIEPFKELYIDKPGADRIRHYFNEIGAVPLSQHYGRIISVATLEHLTDLPGTVATVGLLLSPGGVFRSGIPSEGGFLWGLSWRLTFALAHKFFAAKSNSGFTWAEHMRYEHVNTAPEIIAIIRHFFSDVKIRRFPLPFHHLSFYVAIEAREPFRDRCLAYKQESEQKTGNRNKAVSDVMKP